jgi:hypothetical protein
LLMRDPVTCLPMRGPRGNGSSMLAIFIDHLSKKNQALLSPEPIRRGTVARPYIDLYCHDDR